MCFDLHYTEIGSKRANWQSANMDSRNGLTWTRIQAVNQRKYASLGLDVLMNKMFPKQLYVTFWHINAEATRPSVGIYFPIRFGTRTLLYWIQNPQICRGQFPHSNSRKTAIASP